MTQTRVHPRSDPALKMSFAGIPTLCYAAALWVIGRYPLAGERHRKGLRELAAGAA